MTTEWHILILIVVSCQPSKMEFFNHRAAMTSVSSSFVRTGEFSIILLEEVMKSAKPPPTSQCSVITQTGPNTVPVQANSSPKICPQISAHIFSSPLPTSNRAAPDGDFVHLNGTIKMKAGWTVFTLVPMPSRDPTPTWKSCWPSVDGTTETLHSLIWLQLNKEDVQIRVWRTRMNWGKVL